MDPSYGRIIPPLPHPVALAPGTRFGAYEILARLGAGGFGEVYKARDVRLDRTVAIKVLSSGSAAVGARRPFIHEARTLASLSHPNVLAVYDVGEANGSPYLVTEFI